MQLPVELRACRFTEVSIFANLLFDVAVAHFGATIHQAEWLLLNGVNGRRGPRGDSRAFPVPPSFFLP